MRILYEWWACRKARRRFRGYRPQPVTTQSFKKWIRQFESKDRAAILKLLNTVVYFTEEEVRATLVRLNRDLLKRLKEDGIPPEKIIYVQVHDAGSSSPVMLNMLRDAARLEQLKCYFKDSNDALGMNALTNKLEEGAIIYVDDFAGTGNQFCKQRKLMAQCIVGSFSEFFLVPSICEEAVSELATVGVEPVAGHKHLQADRPLHPSSTILGVEEKNRLTDLCKEINWNAGLGYKGLAAMVVLYRNAPNALPLILRGSLHQDPKCGIFPRITDRPLAC